MSIFKFKENFRQIHAKESKRKNENSDSTFEISEKKKSKNSGWKRVWKYNIAEPDNFFGQYNVIKLLNEILNIFERDYEQVIKKRDQQREELHSIDGSRVYQKAYSKAILKL